MTYLPGQLRKVINSFLARGAGQDGIFPGFELVPVGVAILILSVVPPAGLPADPGAASIAFLHKGKALYWFSTMLDNMTQVI